MRDWIAICLAPLGWRYYTLSAAAEAQPQSGEYLLVGYETMRAVLARSPRSASKSLIERLRRDPVLVAFFGEHRLDVPAAVIEQVWISESPSKVPRTGFSFFRCTKE